MPYAFTGKVLWVDLTSGTMVEEPLPEGIYRHFLSGIGLAAYLLYREIPPGADPLGPQNVLGFVSGLLNATNTLFTGRWMVAARSPLTGAWGEANCGGTLAPAIKRCGYDGIFFKGTSPQPVIFTIIDGKASLRDAGDLWGRDTIETEEHLRSLFPKASVACIGPAGEKLSLIAGIVNDKGRLAARSGLGAVMGAKRLKAIALQGNEKIQVADIHEMQRLSKRAHRWTKFHIPLPPGIFTKFIGTIMRWAPQQMAQDGLLYKNMLRKWGTISMNQVSVELGDAPIQNWRGSDHDFNLSSSASSNPDCITHFEIRKYQCRSCALGCGGIVSNHLIKESHKPEYETTLSWGGLLMNQDLDSIFIANDRLNRAGMDSISAGTTAAFAIECVERGQLPKDALDGHELRWGNSAAILALLDCMIAREGIGDLLADGTRKAVERIGPAAAEFAIHAGGQELAMHDGRNDPGFALHAAVEPMPGRHTVGSQLYYEMFQLWTRVSNLPRIPRFYSKDRKYEGSDDQIIAAVACSRFNQVMNCAGLCLFGAFVGVQRVPVFEWLNAATGWKYTPDDYMRAGARVQALKQLFNARFGIPPSHSVNRRALGLPPMKQGANRDRTIHLDQMVRSYWRHSGWDVATGLPSRQTILELALGPYTESA